MEKTGLCENLDFYISRGFYVAVEQELLSISKDWQDLTDRFIIKLENKYRKKLSDKDLARLIQAYADYFATVRKDFESDAKHWY